MQGHHNRQQDLFITSVDINSLIPEDHFLRKIDQLLDLSFVYELTAPFYNQGKGRPSIDPEVFIRMLLVEYFYKIPSDRELCRQLQYNLAYKWFCGLSLLDKVPDHSSITRVRDRFGEDTFKKIFQKVLEVCCEKGLVKGERLLVDGSLFNADASFSSLVERSSGDNPIDDIKIDNEHLDSSKKNKISGKRFSNDKHVSKTDPDATIAGKQGERKRLRYKAHYTADADSRVVVDCHATTGSTSEVKVFQGRVEAIADELNIKPKEIIADRGYGSAKNLEYLDEKKIESNIPLWSRRSGAKVLEEFKKGFIYDSNNQEAKCPAGHKMDYSYQELNDRVVFKVINKICKVCPKKEFCYLDSQTAKDRGRRLSIPLSLDIFLKTKEKETDPIFKSKLRERMWKIEGLFAEAKSWHGMGRAKYRRRSKVQIQIYMTATVQNIKRMIKANVFDLIKELLGMSKYQKKQKKFFKYLNSYFSY